MIKKVYRNGYELQLNTDIFSSCRFKGGGSTDVPKPQPVPVSASVADKEDAERQRIKKLKGKLSTILTEGLLDNPDLQKNDLLG